MDYTGILNTQCSRQLASKGFLSPFYHLSSPRRSQRQDLEPPGISDSLRMKKSMMIKEPGRSQQPEMFQVLLMSRCLMLRRSLTLPSRKETNQKSPGLSLPGGCLGKARVFGHIGEVWDPCGKLLGSPCLFRYTDVAIPGCLYPLPP